MSARCHTVTAVKMWQQAAVRYQTRKPTQAKNLRAILYINSPTSKNEPCIRQKLNSEGVKIAIYSDNVITKFTSDVQSVFEYDL
eukprot:5814618-Amphidinium_carterae.1